LMKFNEFRENGERNSKLSSEVWDWRRMFKEFTQDSRLGAWFPRKRRIDELPYGKQ